MATLKELHDLICRHITDDKATAIINEGREIFGGGTIYWPPPGSRKDPARCEAIKKAARLLPTGVVASRFGVSRQYVYKVSKK